MLSPKLLGLLCGLWHSQGSDTSFIGWDGHEHPNHRIPFAARREQLRQFLGLRHGHKSHHQLAHPVVYMPEPVVHHGLHMVNHHTARLPRLVPNQTRELSNVSKPLERSNQSFPNLSAMPIEAYAMESTEKNHWTEVRLFRAETCVKMLEKHGIKFTDNKEKCVMFMDKRCKVSSGTGICDEWFDLLNQAYIPGLSPAPAPGVMMAPSPAVAGDKLPSQGFSGKPVAHENMVTMTSDWHREYGKHHRTFQEICAEYPDNLWCKVKGYHKTTTSAPKKEPYKSHRMSMVVFAVVVAALALLVCAVMRGGS